ncbi:MAG: nuclear transport factor 2 family protein [Hormoscilla sp. SP5CHS1]|nr:nuclear transport factor 2 family protein [Hormoscilla sp. SP12CHS1]MBC6455295.1 nuclear transport factor 2 family protein [Hormoscilla sp. SP5CHS1]
MTTYAHTVIKSIYAAINCRDVPAAMQFVDDECIYQDLNFPQPFQGKQAVEQLFTESCHNVPDDLQFVIDEITTGDRLAVGVLWHVELGGIPFPNGRGVSFYRLSEVTGKLVFARDIVEPPIKPGKAAFFIIRLVTPLVRRLLKQ